ncbi:MAG: transposase [Phycisphaerae bacterium]
MPRGPRIVVPGYPHHVTQRGNNRQAVFFVDEDRRFFMDQLFEAAERHGLTVESYCLMSNHFHLVAVPKSKDSLHLALKRLDQLYTQYVNGQHHRSGHLWQDRYFSCALDEEHYWKAMAYVELNPVRASLVPYAWDWPWSSAVAHCGGRDATRLLSLDVWGRQPGVDAWRENLCRGQDPKLVEQIRRNTGRGLPMGSDSFITKLENVLGRVMRILPRGRPRTKKDDFVI